MKINLELEGRDIVALSTALATYVGMIRGKINITHYDAELRSYLISLDEIVKMQYNGNPDELIPLLEKLQAATMKFELGPNNN